ncbi:ATP-binding cassette domain-containing protein, partial [Enterococcus hirae]|nr:ATP-binding cassette domain-containing protein [Enterococcus hirae]
NLSSGQLQKIKLIRALLSKPDILLLDEVFANLDHETSITLINYLRENLLTAIFVYHGDTERLLKQNEYNTLNLDYYAIA